MNLGEKSNYDLVLEKDFKAVFIRDDFGMGFFILGQIKKSPGFENHLKSLKDRDLGFLRLKNPQVKLLMIQG